MKLSTCKIRHFCMLLIVATAVFTAGNRANADIVEVTITNNAPNGGIYLTPTWVGFHNGSFDSYDGGSASSIQLSRLAEDGNTSPIAQTFGANGTLVATGVAQTGSRVQGTLPGVGGVIAPGETVTMQFDVDISVGGSNQFFSYASMVLPSNDYYIANGNPTAIDLSSLSGSPGNSVSFDVTSVNDAGTEINDFDFSAGNPLFPQLGLPVGQTGPNQGNDEFGVNNNVLFPFTGFLNAPGSADTNADFALLNFNDGSLYPNGVATVTISAPVPEPTSFAFASLACVGFFVQRRRRS